MPSNYKSRRVKKVEIKEKERVTSRGREDRGVEI